MDKWTNLKDIEIQENIEEFIRRFGLDEIKEEAEAEEKILDEDYVLTEEIFEEDLDVDDMWEQFLTMECFEELEIVKNIL